MITLSLMVFTGCNKKCPKPQYPKLDAVDRVPYYDYYVVNGALDVNSTQKAFQTIKALRVSENYYYSLIENYRTNFVK